MPSRRPSPKVIEAARQRRAARALTRELRIQWFIQEVSDKVKMTLRQRMDLATSYVLSRVVQNISVPVRKEPGKRTRRIVVTERSKPGEFPRADTTQLMKSIFKEVQADGGKVLGFIGTPLDYAIFLELKLDRAFLTKTLALERDKVTRILTGPIR